MSQPGEVSLLPSRLAVRSQLCFSFLHRWNGWRMAGVTALPKKPREDQSQPSSVQGRVKRTGKGGLDRTSKVVSTAGAPALAGKMLPRGNSEGQEVSLPLSISSSQEKQRQEMLGATTLVQAFPKACFPLNAPLILTKRVRPCARGGEGNRRASPRWFLLPSRLGTSPQGLGFPQMPWDDKERLRPSTTPSLSSQSSSAFSYLHHLLRGAIKPEALVQSTAKPDALCECPQKIHLPAPGSFQQPRIHRSIQHRCQQGAFLFRAMNYRIC